MTKRESILAEASSVIAYCVSFKRYVRSLDKCDNNMLKERITEVKNLLKEILIDLEV